MMFLWVSTLIFVIMIAVSTALTAYHRPLYSTVERMAKETGLGGSDKFFREKPSDALWAPVGMFLVAVLTVTGVGADRPHRTPIQATIEFWNSETPWAYVAFAVFVLAQVPIIAMGFRRDVSTRRVLHARGNTALWVVVLLSGAAMVLACAQAGDVLVGADVPIG